jgi:hypothetical protein
MLDIIALISVLIVVLTLMKHSYRLHSTMWSARNAQRYNLAKLFLKTRLTQHLNHLRLIKKERIYQSDLDSLEIMNPESLGRILGLLDRFTVNLTRGIVRWSTRKRIQKDRPRNLRDLVFTGGSSTIQVTLEKVLSKRSSPSSIRPSTQSYEELLNPLRKST